jgi:hypothetical protein
MRIFTYSRTDSEAVERRSQTMNPLDNCDWIWPHALLFGRPALAIEIQWKMFCEIYMKPRKTVLRRQFE